MPNTNEAIVPLLEVYKKNFDPETMSEHVQFDKYRYGCRDGYNLSLEHIKTITQQRNNAIQDIAIRLECRNYINELITSLSGFINATYTGCSKQELDQLRIKAEAVLANYNYGK